MARGRYGIAQLQGIREAVAGIVQYLTVRYRYPGKFVCGIVQITYLENQGSQGGSIQRHRLRKAGADGTGSTVVVKDRIFVFIDGRFNFRRLFTASAENRRCGAEEQRGIKCFQDGYSFKNLALIFALQK